MNQTPSKAKKIAIILYVLAALWFFVFPIYAHNTYNSNVPSYLEVTLGEYLKYRFFELLPYMLLPAAALAGIGVYIQKKKPDGNKPKAASPAVPQAGNADELRKYKALLDSGAITQEEYEAKKRQLLGL